MAHRAGRRVTTATRAPGDATGPAAPATLWRAAARAAISSPRRIAVAAGCALLAGVAIVGVLSPSPVAGRGADPSAGATAASSATQSIVGSAWGGAGGLDMLDLITKGSLVLILLFITLRVLGRMQASAPRKAGRLNVLESRALASKASLHLVAVGDRRLVVGLTPNGMVALAELGADELETTESPAEQAEASASKSGPATQSTLPQPAASFAGILGSLVSPIDRATDRLAGFLQGGRVR